MKRGDIVKEKKYGLGIIKSATETCVEFITLECSYKAHNIPASNFDANFTRGISSETRALLKKKLSMFERLESYRDKMKELEREITKLKDELWLINKDITCSLGYLTESEFIDEFIKCLPDYVRVEIEKYSVSIDSYTDKFLDIEYSDHIEKYFRHGSFVYEEYDGNMMMCHNAEKDPSYQRYIKNHRRPLSVKTKITEYLTLGDKDWLIYYGCYRLEITENLTKEYAKKLAKKFV